ncbi:probable protein phosphatase 2C 8 [Papaver somniferum]|uniref:probable protein phosphatase 2C 8 n=1 Tax=Papaver somniferum TaxID=3469 RepID=UPI000E7054B0|nr:probable protein phosphatase 2C 8 [Papaver somniferum]
MDDDNGVSGVSNTKRELDSDDSELAAKRSKISECSEKEEEKQNGCEEVKTSQLVLLEKNDDCQSESVNGGIVGDNNQSVKDNVLSDQKSSIPVTKLPCTIEADAAEDKGSRHTMEDASVVLLDASLQVPGKLRCAHFAIYDGHGGRLAAEYAQKHLHANVLSAGLPRELMDVKAAKMAILGGFRRTDELLLQESTAGGWQDGATAVCVWVLGQKVFVANIGDAKAVVARSSSVNDSQSHLDGANPLKAIVLTREHKAIYPQERTRILKAGGSVSSNGRLQGRLEVSRAFGDRNFKKVGVSATPDVHSFDLTERDHFIILGCDGLWGVFGASDAVDFVQKQLKEGLSVTAVSRRLVREAVRERRCKDNCTVIVIVFKHHV